MNNYWRSIEEQESEQNNSSGADEKKEGLLGLYDGSDSSLKSSRRDFLKLFGFSIGVTAVTSSCKNSVNKAISYLVKPEDMTPGKASYFASSFFEDNQFCSILVKVRDGRPIKIEGNDLSDITKGGTTARVQGSVLSLYDTHRFKSPHIDDKEVSWEDIDNQITDELNKLKESGKKLVILSYSVISPSTQAVIDIFKRKYSNTEHIVYDAVSASGILEANKKSFGISAVPSYHFEKALVIVNFGADFLGTWIDPIGFSKGYAKNRDLNDGRKILSKHIQYESNMSLTGSNADHRIIIKPSDEKIILANIYNEIARISGVTGIKVPETKYDISGTVKDLLQYKGKSLVLSGSNDVETQLLVNGINHLLDNYGKTIDISKPYAIKQGVDIHIKRLKKEIENHKVGGLIIYNTNPVYHINGFDAAIKNLDFTVALSSKPNETTAYIKYKCPDHNYLESWNDYEPIPGHYNLSQPVIAPIFNTRQAQESILKWAGSEVTYYDFIRSFWEKNIFPLNRNTRSFTNFWNKSLQKGCVTIHKSAKNYHFQGNVVSHVVNNIPEQEVQALELTLYEKTGIGSGEFANIPWLQELPDPVSRATWDNYLTVSPKQASEMGLRTGDIVLLNNNIRIPVYIQPGQAYNTISIALGYGRKNSGLVADGTGVEAYSLVDFDGDIRKYHLTGVKIEKTGERKEMAVVQKHHSMEGRAIIRETTLEEFLEDPASGNEMHEEVEQNSTTLYKKHEFPGHHWGMAIDLNKCTGCSACVIACQVENNVPVVGRTQVRRVHEMHWIRIDRYYQGDPEAPEVARQPVMCQHCDNAPCENVCPVAATNHSSEGLNQMIYNRCIGTRYCNNNCPYKVRRFNFFDYTGADAIKGNEYNAAGMMLDLPRMVLNPDVTVRAKGVIEKCSFCVQRIQEKKLLAKLEERRLQDGEIKPACAQACPTNAIIFGDLNDPDSKVSKYFASERNYHLLEELHTLPSVGYHTKIRNKKPEVKDGIREHNDYHT